MTKMLKKNFWFFTAALVAFTMLLSPVTLSAWEPKKPVEFIVMAGKGGGADKAVRFMQNIITN